jgi:signal transduction histidine kinase
MASHELRTPMVSIRNYVWMVLNGKGGKVNPKQREYLRRAYDSTSRLSRMVNSMLNLSRIESGRVILSVQQADIRKVIKDVIAEIGMRADKAGIKLTLRQKVEGEKSGEAVQLPSVIIDIDKIKEVLINLIGNSLKFTPAGVKVGITDTGVGLNDEQIPKLFQKFSMLRESYSSNATMAQGTGLGLYICKSIIELHGGKIWIESEGAGKGSTFFFTVPRYSEERLHLLTKNQHNGKDAGIIHSAVTDY